MRPGYLQLFQRASQHPGIGELEGYIALRRQVARPAQSNQGIPRSVYDRAALTCRMDMKSGSTITELDASDGRAAEFCTERATEPRYTFPTRWPFAIRKMNRRLLPLGRNPGSPREAWYFSPGPLR